MHVPVVYPGLGEQLKPMSGSTGHRIGVYPGWAHTCTQPDKPYFGRFRDTDYQNHMLLENRSITEYPKDTGKNGSPAHGKQGQDLNLQQWRSGATVPPPNIF